MFLKGAIAIIVALAVALAWQSYQVQGLEKALVISATQLKAAEVSAESYRIESNLYVVQLEAQAEHIAKLGQERSEAKAQVDEMVDLFQDHDFANLIKRKPGMIENRMIKKTEEVFNDIETLTAN